MDWMQLATLAILTVAAVFAGWQVMEARNDRRQRNRPFIIVDFEPAATIFAELVVSNIGTMPAHDVVAELDHAPDVALERGRWASLSAALFNDGIPIMPPGRAVRMLFDRIPDRVEAELPMRWTATVSYSDHRGNRYADAYPLDLNAWRGFKSIRLKGAHEAVKELEKIRKALENS